MDASMVELSSFRPFEPNEETKEEGCIGNGILFETPLIRASYPVARSSIRRGTTIQCALVPILASIFLSFALLCFKGCLATSSTPIGSILFQAIYGAAPFQCRRHHRLSPKLLAKAFSPSFLIRPSSFPSCTIKMFATYD